MISFELNESLANRYGTPGLGGMVKKAFEFSALNESLGREVQKPIPTTCSVLFSDISGFSERVKTLTPIQIKTFLDGYYAVVIPIIYRNGGLIDQILGDGIISVYSKEMSSGVAVSGFNEAMAAAESIVTICATSEVTATKCALHYGDGVICEVGDRNYRQATLVGNLMTAVHRLEAVAKQKSIAMLAELPQAQSRLSRAEANTLSHAQGWHPKWIVEVEKRDLPGVGEDVEVLYQRLTIGK